MITRCPSCELSFHISDAQLNAARGLVRCGACLKVFNARDYLDSQREPSQPATAKAGTPAESTPLAPPLTLAEDNDFFIDDNFDLALLDQLTGEKPVGTIKEGEPQQPQQGQEVAAMDGQSENTSAKNSQLQTAPAPLHPPEPPLTAAKSAEYPPLPPPPAATVATKPQANQMATATEPDTLGPTQDASSDTQGLSVADIPHNLAAPAFDADDFNEQDSDRTASPSGWLWYPLLFIGLLALPLQYAHFHADILGQDLRWRPAMEKLCLITHCSLAALTNLGQITATNLVVRSHPDQVGALRVDATLFNGAPFPQPFPSLTLRFDNLDGEIVAARTFTPDKYLGGELKGAVSMPSQQPVKLELDILDPGHEAVSYSLMVTDSSRQ